MSFEEMRLSYANGSLDITDVDSDPLVQFQAWFDQARNSGPPDWLEVNAMTLSTTDGGQRISSRIVLLKGIHDGQFFFYTNYLSTKGRQMEQCPQVALCFFWPHLQRQVRINGTVVKADRERSEKYFHSRPRGSQLGAIVSEQSAEVESRAWLEQRMEELSQEHEGGQVPCPDHWGGYAVTPKQIEFWQGRQSRLHDRIVYQRNDAEWKIVRLAP